jgi:uncharacterized protein YecE (DUF72 family)
MRVFAGTSGFCFDEWQGHFYPPGLAASARLTHYASRLRTVEINNTFYQMPNPAVLARWYQAVPGEFHFALKAPRRITHSQRLKPEGDALELFVDVASTLGPKLGVVLFQLPPFLRMDEPLLAEFLDRLPASLRASFEFRHPSWFNDRIFERLAEKKVALCCGDSDQHRGAPQLVATADFGYVRLRAPSYDAASLREWSKRIRAQSWRDAYVYLKHENLGPDYALFISAVAFNEPEPALPTQISPGRDAKGPKRAVARAADGIRRSRRERRAS